MALSNHNHRNISPCVIQRRGRPRRLQSREYRDSAYFFALLSLALSSSVRQSSVAAEATADMEVVGYYGPHRFRGRNGLSKPENIDFTKLTRINYGPFQINEHGSIWGTDVNADPKILFGPHDWNAPIGSPMHCHQSSSDAQMHCAHHFYEMGLIHLAHVSGVGVYAFIGGPERSEKFSQLAANPEARIKFAQNAASFMKNYDFDGLDMAWQFPKSPEDMSNYGILLSEVRMALDKESQRHDRSFGLTATLPCGHDMEFIDIRLLSSVLSEFNLVSYGFYGPWGGVVGANSPLYDPNSGEDSSVNGCVLKYVEGGAMKNQINVGLAFSGQSFRGGKYMGDVCKTNWAGVCSDTQSWQEDGGAPQYHSIYKKMSDMTLSFDQQTMTPLAYNNQGAVSFDDPRSICLKAEYAISNGLNGFTITDLTGDMLDDRSTPLLDALNLKLLKHGIECGGDEFEALFQWRKVIQYNPHSARVGGSVSNEPKTIDSKSGPTYRYTCGVGEGNARDRCNNYEWDDIGCDNGTCPSNFLCFVVLCTKPRDHELHEKPDKASLSKTKPKPKRKPRLKSVEKENYPPKESKTQLVLNNAEELLSREGLLGINNGAPTNAAAKMTFSCGINFERAKSCGNPCPNGLTDCPSGQFCFWLQCGASNLVPAASSASSAPTKMKYQCGETRSAAMTCSEDCGAAWQCPDGKDCYSVPCPM
mmetsp:Transcript_56406/g.119893  ORF Transcript_56406/g.119893 Transcript_56406/m.119893 type:complete len:702 (+) Transcript_56406:36-2141(+)